MDDDDNETRSETRRDSVSMVAPYARIRVIVAVIVFLFVIAVMVFRAFSG
ncbi:hypothetical protein [Thalassovita aquimarina]|uniref:Uncharacterized protein n=1 Tax=Thalassovita aquimarina TaxID=2785917 RepID=A0ABS5HS47_9RHOB|nr:hypothetical protein [Thalassovita aquimarina]MBR9651781.1 hypothetical protein [Thalassovita aquimarina]